MSNSQLKTQRPQKDQYSVEVTGSPDIPGEGKPRRNALCPDKLIVHPNGATTLYENFLNGVKEAGDGNFLGRREIKDGPYVWQSYREVQKRVSNFGSGLNKMGLKPKDLVGFFSINTPEYVMAQLACYQYNFISVPLYDTLGAEAIEFIVNQTEMVYSLVTANKVQHLLNMKDKLPTLKTIIITDQYDPELTELANSLDVKIVNFNHVEKDGSIHPVEAKNAKPDDTAIICYTSGTTGTPKGVVLTHKNIMANVASVRWLAENGKLFLASPDDVHISYLPLAHVFELVNTATMIYGGTAIGFYQGDTLKLLDDIAELKPTVFISVPRLLNRVYDKVIAGVKAKGGVAQWMFTTALNTKKNGLNKGNVDHWMWDRVAFAPIRARLGGRVRTILSGAAPISSEVMDFLRIAFSADVYEGYGQTENAACLTITLHGDIASGHVGSPQVCVEVKLIDVPDMHYTSKDKPYPRGEICVRGHSVFHEYYKLPEKTAETLDKDGWCHTGDIGQWDKCGRLVIIDRVKNIFKLAQGEYIVPEKIEKIYTKHELVFQAFVYGDSLQPSLVAVIVPNDEALLKYVKQNNLIKTSYKKLCTEPQIKKHFLQTLNKYGKANDLKGFECIKNIHLAYEPFSIANGLLTPTFKLKRHQARIKFQKEIDQMYMEIS
ncbi:11536_t:CDS:2 [Funneliformis geosporum]|uniref:Long-chain-fatty-acid--CoA ligase n=1 Tax=Funneliformis geosporum TaxID=1117311 RepID=A0A9W4SY14_9GLOM|nr:11536_t:CDS:2 [Funneliformis geosporum]CAI2185656.1 5790_t:CDS:2 [Funneliformis geosporum]